MTSETRFETVGRFRNTFKVNREVSDRSRVVVVVDLNGQIKEKYSIFKAIMGEETESSIDQNGAKLVNKDVELLIISTCSIRGLKANYFLDLTKNNDLELIRVMDGLYQVV